MKCKCASNQLTIDIQELDIELLKTKVNRLEEELIKREKIIFNQKKKMWRYERQLDNAMDLIIKMLPEEAEESSIEKELM